jgi:hypothetical protein
LLVTACSSAQPEPSHPNTFEFEPGLYVPLTDDGKADLPNSAFAARPLDTSGYRAIANLFAASYDVKPTGIAPAYDWPLTGSRAVLNREGTPIRLGSDVYEHTGLDVIRVSEMESPVVHAPLDGTAQITDWAGGHTFPNGDYSTVISIWDPATHYIVQLMHVKPDPMLPKTGFFQVTRGQPLGELADIGITGGRHTHVNVIDGQQFVLVDPITALPYPDTTQPVIDDIYLLDMNASRPPSLQSGPMDIIVTSHDRDDMSPRNLEVSSIAYTATDQAGNVVGHLDRCQFADAFTKLAADWSMASSTIRLIDFGSATGQFSGFWPGSDLGNPDRLFRYAVTNLLADQNGCHVVASDRDGQIMISPDMTALTITVDVWDQRDNHQTKQVTLLRDGSGPGTVIDAGVDAAPGLDAGF